MILKHIYKKFNKSKIIKHEKYFKSYCRSIFGRFFAVGVNEPKPNGPDTINLVEKMGSRTGL